jgi:chromosome segregation ATPase
MQGPSVAAAKNNKSADSPSRGPPRTASPSNVIRGKQLKELRAENDRLENELQNLRISYRSADRCSDGKNQPPQECAHKRFALESYLRELVLEISVLDREIAKRRNSQTKVLEEQSENELRLAELLKEEKILNARRQVKLDQRKEDLKMETKRHLAGLNIQKRLIESDIQSLTDATARMKQLRGEFAHIPPEHATGSPEKREQLMARLAQVRGEVKSLDVKCRTLQDFVAVRSPDRYAAIVNERRCAALRASSDC